MIDFAYKLKALRELRGWSQDELAKRLGVSRSAIGNYEQRTREPDFEALENIADVFNCPIAYLVESDRLPSPAAPTPTSQDDFSPLECEIICRFRVADEFDRETVLRALRVKGENLSDSQNVYEVG